MTGLIWLNVLIVGLIALAAAVILHITAQKFAVPANPLADKIETLLPQANCGACGKAGCCDFAKACASADKDSLPNYTARSAAERSCKNIADVLGYAPADKAESCAVLRCNGSCQNALRKTVIPACTIAGLPIWLRLEVPAARTAASVLAIASASANLMPCTLIPKQACPSLMPLNAPHAALVSTFARGICSKSARWKITCKSMRCLPQ